MLRLLGAPGAFDRHHRPGHFTASALVVSPDRRQVLVTHHRKLGQWLQLGGHCDGDPDLLAVALRETAEESGLTDVRVLGGGRPYDLDVHRIPGRPEMPAHVHHDVIFLMEADPAQQLTISSESLHLAWVPVTDARLAGNRRLQRALRGLPGPAPRAAAAAR